MVAEENGIFRKFKRRSPRTVPGMALGGMKPKAKARSGKVMPGKSLLISAMVSMLLLPQLSQAQGLLGLDAISDYWEDTPLSVGVSVKGGWDGNISGSSNDEQDSTFVSAAATLAYGSTGSQNNVRIEASFGVTHYLDAADLLDETNYSVGAAVNFSRLITPRMEFANNLYVSYEIEPELAVGGTTARPDGQYFYFSDHVSLTYAWTRRLSATVNYNVSGILYQDDALAATEDRFNHQVGLGVSYRLSERTSVLGDYRFAFTDYQNFGSDATSHFLLGGIEHAFSPRLRGMARLGAQYYDSDRTSVVVPYLEASLAYRVSRRTSVSWFNRLGFEGAELGTYDSRYTFRTGLSARHQFTERLSGNAGIHYSYSLFEFDDGVANDLEQLRREVEEAREDVVAAAEALGVELADEQLAGLELDEEELIQSEDLTEHQIGLSLGLAYRLFANVDFNAGYHFTAVESNSDERSYERHSAYMGLGAHF